ncbi:thioredoxin-like protein [Sporodiniella umbellata]|nr:thioredoxin-like protein [Sporodiniella umbellata]
MKFIVSIILLLSILLRCQAVIELTDENFSALVQKENEWLVDFYADWCGFCKRFESTFYEAERQLQLSEYKNVQVGVVNVETNPGLAARFLISRLPTVVYIKNHEVRPLPVLKTVSDVVSFVTLEKWQEVSPKSGLVSPFSLFGKLLGFVGKFVKKASTFSSPWTLIGGLSGFLVLVLCLPFIYDKLKNTEKKKTQ